MSNQVNETKIKAPETKQSRSVLIGAAFLMATSAIGPGFLTQTSTFTAKFMASFGIVILLTILLDVITQLNVWRIIGVSGLRGQEIANKVLPGLGVVVACLVALGGLAFNTGNVGGAALGMNALLGVDQKLGMVICGALAIFIFLSKDAKAGMDKATKILGGLILLSILTVAISSQPPVGEVAAKLFNPDNPMDLLLPMITLLGGSCGGYITFSGAHRLLDAGFSGEENLPRFQRSVLTGIGVSGTVRILLFLAVFGVCSAGGAAAIEAVNKAANPAAEAFRLAAGDLGYRLFGIALMAAGITSIIGAAYTSVSFLKTLHPMIAKNEKWVTIGFILVSTVIMVILGSPKALLIVAGALNGMILPITLGTILLASRNKKIVGENYKHPTILIVAGVLVVAATAFVGVRSLPNMMQLFK